MIIQTRLIYELSRLIEQHSSYVGIRVMFTNIKTLRCLPIDRQKNLSHLLKLIIKKYNTNYFKLLTPLKTQTEITNDGLL